MRTESSEGEKRCGPKKEKKSTTNILQYKYLKKKFNYVKVTQVISDLWKVRKSGWDLAKF
jgi:hypothetical protein